MPKVTYRSLQIATSAFILLNTAYLFFLKPDWWIYGWLSLLAGVVNLVDRPSCGYWRLAASVVIVLGTIETLFLTWTIRQLELAPVFADNSNSPPHGQLPEGRNILLTALATSLTISARLKSAQHNKFADYFRTLVILGLVVAILPTIGYSILFYVPPLANVVTHVIG